MDRFQRAHKARQVRRGGIVAQIDVVGHINRTMCNGSKATDQNCLNLFFLKQVEDKLRVHGVAVSPWLPCLAAAAPVDDSRFCQA
jgi:hypothetical protein